VAATAGRSHIATPPANAWVSDFLPGTEAAGRAGLVICNGGSSTTYQALASGVPVLALVSNNMDQHLNMAAIRRAGAGMVIRARGATASAIRSAATRMLEDGRYRLGAAAIAEAHRAWRVEERFPALVGELIGR